MTTMKDRVAPLGGDARNVSHQEIGGGVNGSPTSPELLGSKSGAQGPVIPDSESETHLSRDPSIAKFLLFIEIVIIVCFLLFVNYDATVATYKGPGRNSISDRDITSQLSRYPMFQDVHVMIFIGFGYLMTFLRHFGYGALGYNMMLAAIAIQWSVLCRGIFNLEGNHIPVSLTTIINGDFAAASVLISFGAVLGVASPTQLLGMCIIEVFFYALNEYVGVELMQVADVGGSLFIHTFGAYFGLAVSFMLRRQQECTSELEESSYTSDIFAMIGTIFLWIYWPSFNGAMADGDYQHRAVINTILSLTGSCIFTFIVSAMTSPKSKFSMVHIQNATLAGGVAIGAVADLNVQPFGSLAIGAGAGVLSTLGYVYITPFLQDKIGLHDTCGVHNLHGMPGVASGLLGAIMAILAAEGDYGKGVFVKYPARSPYEGSSELAGLQLVLNTIQAGSNRSASEQAIYQVAALCVTLLFGIVGGVLTGGILRLPVFAKVPREGLFDDSSCWDVSPHVHVINWGSQDEELASRKLSNSK